MTKVLKTWDRQACIKNTQAGKFYYCNCPNCTQERTEQIRLAAEQRRALEARLKSNVRNFWTEEYSSYDKLLAQNLLQAGHEDEPKPLTDEEKDEMADCGC